MDISPRTRGLFFATVASVVWGTVPVAGAVALGGVGPTQLSTLRLLSAGLVIAAVLGRRGAHPFRRPPRLVLLAAAGLAANYVGYMVGLGLTGPAVSQVLVQTAALFLILVSVVWLKERPTRRQLAGAAVAVAGVFLVSGEGPAVGRLAGTLAVLGSALAWGIYGAAHRRLGRDHASGPTTMWIFLLAACGTAPFTLTETAPAPDLLEGAAIAYLCLNTLVAYWSFGEAVRTIDASLAAVITTLGPVVTFTLLHFTNRMDQGRIPYEAMTAGKLMGAGLVVAGVAAAVSGRRGRGRG